MTQIITFTGREQHSSYGAKGYVFIINPETKEESFLRDGQHGVTLEDEEAPFIISGHAHWQRQTWTMPDGAILKLFSIGTRRGGYEDGGGIYLRVEANAPRAHAEGQGYQDRAAWVEGPLVALPVEALAGLGISIPAKLKRMYRRTDVTVRLLEEGGDHESNES